MQTENSMPYLNTHTHTSHDLFPQDVPSEILETTKQRSRLCVWGIITSFLPEDEGARVCRFIIKHQQKQR